MTNLRRRGFILFAAALAAGSVAAQPAASPQAVERLLHETSGAQVLPYSTRDFGRDKYAAGRSVRVLEAGADALLSRVRAKLPAGWVAWIGVTHDLADKPAAAGVVELAAAPGRDQFDILRAAATDGANYDLQTEDIVKELQAWDREFGIDIRRAESDTVQLRLKKLPKNVKAFAQRVYKFCPDIVEQGVGSVEELEKAIVKDKMVYLWWD